MFITPVSMTMGSCVAHSDHKRIQQIGAIEGCQRNDPARLCKGAGRCQGFAEKRPGHYVHAEGVGPTEGGKDKPRP